uniref:Uncharacterized protein n=1 Tax=Arundo donax TaxID=35708 RepID=A0A0A8YB95_ARUDO
MAGFNKNSNCSNNFSKDGVSIYKERRGKRKIVYKMS